MPSALILEEEMIRQLQRLALVEVLLLHQWLVLQLMTVLLMLISAWTVY
jgi:hypothetical protein